MTIREFYLENYPTDELGIELNETYSSGQYTGERISRYPEYTNSLSDKANLLPVVEAIMARPLTEDEKEAYHAGYDWNERFGDKKIWD